MNTPTCRSCQAADLLPVLSLGTTPLANALRTASQLTEPEERFPLDLAFCRQCALLQILQNVPPEKLFGQYLYFSSFSDTMLRSARELVDRLSTRPRRLVVEIASNDGYLLQFYRQRDIPVLGIEPARNIARVARNERGIPTVSEFFGRDLAGRLHADGVSAGIIHANNVFAHVPDLNGFVEGLRLLLHPEGVAVIEVPYARDMLEHCEFDTIYHEHLCYYSLTTLTRLFARHGLGVHDVECLPIHGGSLRLFVNHAGAGNPSTAVQQLLAEEARWGVDEPAYYQGFAARVENLRDSLRSTLAELKRHGARVAAYGASAKGCTLLNYCGIGREHLEYVVDRSTVKQCLYTPGTHLPIHAPQKLIEDRPDCVLLLTWNFAEEIIAQQAAYRRLGGTFLVPVPEPRFLLPTGWTAVAPGIQYQAARMAS